MSRDILDDKLRQEGMSEREHYDAADLGFDETLVGEVLRWHLNQDYEGNGVLYQGLDYFDDCVDEIAAIVGTAIPEQFNSQAFLDTLISRMEISGEDTFFANYLFSPLMQHFYSQGHNGFSLDLSHLERDYYWTVVRELHGTEEEPLELAFNGPEIYHCGANVSHCRLTISGDVYVLGCSASHSEFIYTGKRELVRVHGQTHEHHGSSYETTDSLLIGNGAEHCVFKLPDYIDAHYIGGLWEDTEMRISLSKSDGTGDTCRVKSDFFDDKNQLLVPDGNGGWKEVREI